MKKNQRRKKLNKKGFTLIELLVVITLLSLVMAISIYFISSTLKKAKEKTYLTTINEVEKAAGNYLLENSDSIFFVTGNNTDIQYQCITVGELVEYGFLNEDVTDSKITDEKTLKKEDYIYIERNPSSKTVEKNVLVIDDSYSKICAATVDAEGSISFNFNNAWEKEKNVTINYALNNIKKINESSNYKYYYDYKAADESSVSKRDEKNFDNGKNAKFDVFGITKVGEISAKIINSSDSVVVESPFTVSKIDNVGPEISFDGRISSGNSNEQIPLAQLFEDVSMEADIPISISDFGIGLDESTLESKDFKVTVGGHEIGLENIILRDLNSVSGNGDTKKYKYILHINNKKYNGIVSFEVNDNSFFDKLGNPNAGKIVETNYKFDNKYTITLDGNGATNDDSRTKNVTVSYGSTYPGTGKIVVPVRKYEIKYDIGSMSGVSKPSNETKEYDFLGWSINSQSDIFANDIVMNNTVLVRFEKNMDGYTDENGKWIRTDDATLYAKWFAGNKAKVTLPVITKNDYICYWRLNSISGKKYDVGSEYIPTSNTTFYLQCEDNKKPNASISSTSNLKSSSQSVRLNCSDNSKVTEYYFGTEQPKANYSNINFEVIGKSSNNFSKDENIFDSGKYYFICKDDAGNYSSTEEIIFNKYIINNAFLNVSGNANIYNNDNYSIDSTYTYIIPKGTTIAAQSVYTVPVGSNVNKYRGYSVGEPGFKEITLSNGNFKIDEDSAYTLWFNRNEIHIKYRIYTSDDEVLMKYNYDSSGNKLRSWTVGFENVIYKYDYQTNTGGDNETIIRYGATSMDLNNYNNAQWLNITKKGYSAVPDAEWECEFCVQSKTFSQKNIQINGTDGICAEAKDRDCNRLVHVNWQPNNYKITYNANGGSNAPSPVTYTYDKNGSLNLANGNSGPTREGYQFVSWNTQSDGKGTKYDLGASYSKGNDTNITLYAQWSKVSGINDYRCTYSNGIETKRYFLTNCYESTGNCNYTSKCEPNATTGVCNYPNPQSGEVKRSDMNYCKTLVKYDCSTNGGSGDTVAWVASGNNADLGKSCSKSGWTFVGWNTNKDATSKLSSYKVGNSSVTLYAIYKKDVVITFDTNGSGTTLTHTETNRTSTTTLAVSCTTYNNDGCRITTPSISGAPYFYSTDKNDKSEWNTAGKNHWWHGSLTGFVKNNQTLYVVYDKYTINFNKNNASSIGETSRSCIVAPKNNASDTNTLSCSVTSPSITAPSGYSVVGWNTNKDATSSQWKSGDVKTITKNDNGTTYYAIIKKNPSSQTNYHVTLYSNGGIGNYSYGWSNGVLNQYYYNTWYFPSDLVQRTGYAFAGWRVNETGKVYNYYVDSSDNGYHLYAKWATVGGSGGGTGATCYCNVNEDCNKGWFQRNNYDYLCDLGTCYWCKGPFMTRECTFGQSCW